jgi:hypothetical protein
MTSEHDPTSRALAKRLLEAGRKSDPVRYNVAVGLSRHQHLVAAGVALPAWATVASAKALGATLATKIVVGSIVAIAAGTLAYRTLAPQSAVETPTKRPAPPAAAALSPKAPRPDVSAIPFESLPSPERPAAVRSAAPADVPADVPAAATASAPPEEIRLEESPETPAPKPAATDPSVEEMRAVAEAERLLESDPARALSLTRSLEERFPNGYLEQERRYVAVAALFKTGGSVRARAAAEQFLKDYPSGPFANRVRRMLGGR